VFLFHVSGGSQRHLSVQDRAGAANELKQSVTINAAANEKVEKHDAYD
jgi:hypothetical protein